MTQNTIHSTAHVDDDDDDEFEIDHVKSEQVSDFNCIITKNSRITRNKFI